MSQTSSETMPKDRQGLFAFLDSLGISYKTCEHPPVFTVAESVALRDSIEGGHTKNLFLKDKKDQFFLLTVEEHAIVDLKTVHHAGWRCVANSPSASRKS